MTDKFIVHIKTLRGQGRLFYLSDYRSKRSVYSSSLNREFSLKEYAVIERNRHRTILLRNVEFETRIFVKFFVMWYCE